MEIPECLVADILTRLPIKSILRFRAVCKSWYADLPNPATHLFTVDPDDQILYKHHQNQTDEVFSLISFNNPDHISPPQKLPLVKQTANSVGYTGIAGCCNGIVLLKDGLGMCLWNPATGETKVLPEFKLFHDRDDFEGTYHDVGLCFDVKTSDFKVILVFCPIKNVHERDYVYSLRSDSWKIVESRSPECPLYDNMYDIAMNSLRGMCHWFGSYLLGERCEEAILSFDANRETFITTIMPYKDLYPYLQRDCDRGFFMLKDYVAMFHIGREGWGETFEIWAMLEVGAKESWIKVMSIGPTVPFRKVLRFWTNRKVFLYTSDEVHEEAVVTFDILTGKTSPFLKNTNMPRFMLATNYKKSQVQLCARAGKLH